MDRKIATRAVSLYTISNGHHLISAFSDTKEMKKEYPHPMNSQAFVSGYHKL